MMDGITIEKPKPAASVSRGARLEALSGEVDRVRLAVDCIHDMAVGLPDDVREALNRIEALAKLAADKLHRISDDLDRLAQEPAAANTNAR